MDEDSRLYKLYISHLDDDKEEYELFLSKLNASYEFKWKDYASQDTNLEDQMKQVDVLIILSGYYNKHKKQIQAQIDAALKLNKPIIVIRPYGMENIPANLENISTDVVGWNTSCIIDSIMEALNEELEY